MLQKAVELAEAGRAVYVICHSDTHAAQLRNWLRDLGQLLPGIQIEGPDLFSSIHWDTMRVPASHSNCVFLMDHALIEKRFHAQLQALHFFDAE